MMGLQETPLVSFHLPHQISNNQNLFNSTDDTSDVPMYYQNKTNANNSDSDSVAVREQVPKTREQIRKQGPKYLSDYVQD